MASEKGMYRIFQLIRLLNSTPRRTVRQLEALLGTSNSQLHRDLNLLENLGYSISTDEHHRKFLAFNNSGKRQSTLDQEELFFLQQHLQRTAGDAPQAQTILQKFDLNLSMIPLADALPQLHASRIYRFIQTGIELRKCLCLINYHSLSSNVRSNRKIEPLEVTPDYRYLIAWDIEKERQSQFKLSRIEDVDILDLPVSSQHIASPMDIFGLTGEQWNDVKLLLSDLALHLLLEEFPLAQPYIKRRTSGVFFEGPVRSWKGIGRFILGLPGEIQVISPEPLKTYLKERLDKVSF